MSEREPEQAELDEYIQSLPAAARPARDLSARRQRMLPALRTHAAREQGRARRRRVLIRAAGITALAGASAAAALWVGAPWRPTAANPPRNATAGAPASLTVLDGAVLLESAGVARTLHRGE